MLAMIAHSATNSAIPRTGGMVALTTLATPSRKRLPPSVSNSGVRRVGSADSFAAACVSVSGAAMTSDSLWPFNVTAFMCVLLAPRRDRGAVHTQALILKLSAYWAGLLPSHTTPSISFDARMPDFGSGVPVIAAASL